LHIYIRKKVVVRLGRRQLQIQLVQQPPNQLQQIAQQRQKDKLD